MCTGCTSQPLLQLRHKHTHCHKEGPLRLSALEKRLERQGWGRVDTRQRRQAGGGEEDLRKDSSIWFVWQRKMLGKGWDGSRWSTVKNKDLYFVRPTNENGRSPSFITTVRFLLYSDCVAVWICLIYIPSVKTVHIKLKVVRDAYMYCCWPFLLMWPSGNYCWADVSSYNATGQNNAVLICLVSGKGLWKQWWPHRQEATLIDEGMLGGKVGLWLGYVQHKGGCLIRKEVKRQKAGNRLLKNEQLERL